MNFIANLSEFWTEGVSMDGVRNTSGSEPELVNILQSELLPSLVYVTCLFPVGVIGNILALCVYQRKWRTKRKVSTLFILTLAWVDLLNCLATMPFEIALIVNITSFDFPVLCKISRWMTYHLNCFSTMILLGIALDRLFGIRYPFKKALFGIKRCKAYLVLSFVIGIVTTWPALVLFGTFTQIHHGILSKTCLINDDYVSNKKAIQPFWHGIYLISSILVVDTALILIYSLIGCSIHHDGVGSSSFKRARPVSSASIKRISSLDPCSCNSKCLVVCPSCTLDPDKALTNITESFEDDVFVDTPSKLQTREKIMTNKSCSMASSCSSYTDQSLQKQMTPTKSRISSFFQLPSQIRKTRSSSVGSKLSQVSGRHQRLQSFSNESARFGPRSGTRKTLAMLCIVTVVFILTFLPYCVIVILRYTSPGIYLRLSTTEKNIYQLFKRSYMLSMSTNSIIYSFVNNNFRQECYLVIKSGLTMLTVHKNHN